ncbi:MAG: hypothetical protein CMB47_03440 [Euryarchaeota archaeon]|nr:hypothetical protein [Euryarchaeota archaeon]
MEQFGGGSSEGSFEERCSRITFEDIFEYTKAEYHFQIDQDWQSAEVFAKAWINWSMADVVRERLDSYLEGFLPSGGDGWLSTDERDAVMSIAADCIEHTITRIGIRDGPPHRGGVGVDWKNTSWEGDSIIVNEVNGVPSRHSEIRTCESYNLNTPCYEIPVIPSENRDCDTDIDNTLGLDECRFILYLNSTLELSGISDPESFTIALNASNMSNAELKFSFPLTNDLRLDMWEECEGRYVGLDIDLGDDYVTPLRGSCIGDQSSNYSLDSNNDILNYTIFPNSDKINWPSGEDIFADFTTLPVPIDNPPVWTEAAPIDGTWFPLHETGEVIWADWEQISTWFNDELGVSNLDISCFGDLNSSIRQNINGSLYANIEYLQEITCEARDSSGQTSGNRTWHIGKPILLSTTSQSLQNPHPIYIEVSDNWPPLAISIALYQDVEPIFSEFLIESSTYVNVTSIGLTPGAVKVKMIIAGENIYQSMSIYDLGIIKESSPPFFVASSTGFSISEPSHWSARGQFSDPDGEEVSFSFFIDDSLMGTLEPSGNTWEIPEINFNLWPEGEYEIKLEGCDESGICAIILFEVNNSHLYVEELVQPISQDSNEERFIPFTNLYLIFISVAGALMYTIRRD